jgi:multicomponent K+:H+ antiporter subunit F
MSPLLPLLLAAAPPPEAPAPVGHGSALEPALLMVINVGVAAIVLGILLCIYRLLKGPHLSDRVLAIDTMGIHVVALVILLAIRQRSTMFFDAVLVIAIIGFASTVALSQYLHARKAAPRPVPDPLPPPATYPNDPSETDRPSEPAGPEGAPA